MISLNNNPNHLKYYIMKRIFITLIIVASSLIGFAQQDAMFTHYMFNTLAVNPGYAGTRDALTVTGLHRTQWVGFNGAPTTQTLTLHSPIYNENMGLGLSILADKIGPTDLKTIYVDYSYRIKVNEKSSLRFGLKAGLNIRQNGLADLSLNDPNDQSFSVNEESHLLPNFGFGMYYYTDKYYVGLSIPRLLQNDFNTNVVTGGTDIASEKRHYFLIAGTVFNVNENIKLKPTTLLKVTHGAPVELDITGTLLFKDLVWAGLMYRTGDALGVLIGANITPQLAIGYSYDWSFGNRTFKYNYGSHEIMLMYDFIYKDKSKIRSPRYF